MLSRFSFPFALGILFVFSIQAHAVDITWIHEDHGPGFDAEWKDFLADQGHNVENRLIFEMNDVLAEELSRSQLIIFSRDTNSGNYDDSPEEIAGWNTIQAPMIIMTPYVLRSSRWRMVDSTSISDTTGTLEAVLPNHPLFEGGVLDGSNQVDMWDETILGPEDNIDLIDVADVGNGTLIAQDPGTNLVWAAYWEQGVEYYDGSGQFAGGNRLFLSGGSDDDPLSWGGKNYTPEADQILLNAIDFMATPRPDNPGDFNQDGAIDTADFDIMVANFRTGNSHEEGDINFDFAVDLQDFVEFAGKFNGGAAAVPEPSTWVLAVLVLLGILGCRRRRR